MNKVFELAGHKFTLKKVQICDFMSEETTAFTAEMYCDGKFLCHCDNEGHGGATRTYCTPETKDRYYDIMTEVGRQVWMRCMDGTVLYHNLGTVADETLFYHLLARDVSRNQKNALVFKKAVENPDDFTSSNLYWKPMGDSIKQMVESNAGLLIAEIVRLQSQGWEVLNTNIPARIYEEAKKWRTPESVFRD